MEVLREVGKKRWRYGRMKGSRDGRMEERKDGEMDGRKDGGHGGEWDSFTYGTNGEVLEKEKEGDCGNWDEAGRQAGRIEARLCLSTMHNHHDASSRSN